VIDGSRQAEKKPETSGGGTGKVLLLLAALIIAVIMIFLYYREVSYTAAAANEVWTKTVTESGTLTFRGYSQFDQGVIMYTKDGAEYTDEDGRSIWQKSYQMNNPIIAVSGGFAVIADQGGMTACIFSNEQSTGTVSSAMPISKVTISEKGVVYAVCNDSSADFLTAYRKDGSAIDLTVKSVMDGDGYPFDIAASPDGSQLITSYISIADNEVRESVVFRNFGEVGQNTDARRVVGGFIDEFEGHIVTKVGFPDEEHAHAFYDSGIVFFSTKVLNSPAIIKNEAVKEEILSVGDSRSYVVLVTAHKTEEGKKTLRIYDQDGRQTGSADFEMNYTGMEVSENGVTLYSADRILEYTGKGRLAADITYGGKITSVIPAGRLRKFFVAESGKMLLIQAK